MIAAVADEAFARVSALAPAGIEVRRLGGDLSGVGFLVPAFEADIELGAAASLRVVQALSAGTDWIEERVPPWATLCNARTARDVPVAEWIVGALLGACSGLLQAGRDRRWAHVAPTELAGSEVLILGHGSIGRATGARLEALGVTVRGVARRARAGAHGADELPTLLPRADAVVVLLPLSSATRGAVDAAFLARMRDGALLVNAGRGATVDTPALLAELESGRLRAVLDVVDPEPLPVGHPLWSAPGLLSLTSHQAGDSSAADRRAADLAGAQLGRAVRGEPLLNVVRAGSPQAPDP